MFPRFCLRSLVCFLLATAGSSAIAQPPSLQGSSGDKAPVGLPELGATTDSENQASVITNEIASLPSKGVVPVKVTNSIGGVIFSETRGIALVLSSNPLVLVTNPAILDFDGKNINQLRSDLQRTLVISTYTPVYGGMGGGYPGGQGGKTNDINWAENVQLFALETDEKQDGSLGTVKCIEASDLLFIFLTSSNSDYGGISSPSTMYQRAQLGSAAGFNQGWTIYSWENGNYPSKPTNSAETIIHKIAAAVSTGGQARLISEGKIYGHNEIMNAYLTAYQLYKKDKQASVSNGTTNTRSTNQSLPPDSPIANIPASSTPIASTDYDQSIIKAVVNVKTAANADAREIALKTLTEILVIEFDAHRSLKASEIQSLRQRLEEIEKAEAKKVENRTEILNERIRKLLGVQSVENEKPLQ